MHQTTLRFPEDLWQLLETEATKLGISVAQYVREAALARAAYEAGRRGEAVFLDPAVFGGLTRGDDPPFGPPSRTRAATDRAEGSTAAWPKAGLTQEGRGTSHAGRDSGPSR